MEKALIVDANRCIGCRICELVCSMTNYGEYNPRKAHIWLIQNREMDANVICIDIECDFGGECVRWCPSQVLSIVTLEEAAIIRRENKKGIYPAPVLRRTARK